LIVILSLAGSASLVTCFSARLSKSKRLLAQKLTSNNMKMLLTITLLVSLLATLVAGKNVAIYQVSIGGNATLGTACANRGQSIGPELIANFSNIVPWVTPYSGRRRHLKEAKHRKLSVNICKDTNCDLRRNWDFCYFNGCNCACGHRRMLVQGDINGGDIQAARKAMEDAVATAADEIDGCSLSMDFNKFMVDSSTL
jgi:hypothetical protein